MSKQSNQRYRKEIEKDNLKKAGMNNNSSTASAGNSQTGNKINREFNAPSNKAN